MLETVIAHSEVLFMPISILWLLQLQDESIVDASTFSPSVDRMDLDINKRYKLSIISNGLLMIILHTMSMVH